MERVIVGQGAVIAPTATTATFARQPDAVPQAATTAVAPATTTATVIALTVPAAWNGVTPIVLVGTMTAIALADGGIYLQQIKWKRWPSSEFATMYQSNFYELIRRHF